MKAWRNVGIAAMTGCLIGVVSCEGDDKQSGPSADAASDSSAQTCNGTVCTAPTGAEFNQVTTCCLSGGGCGLEAPFVSQCLAPSQPGAFDITCVPFTPPRGEQMDGCCGPNGCGALNPFMGCISNTDLGREAVACNYDPTNDCRAVAEIPCDGAEDCAAGEHCCAKSANAGYVEFGCFASCTALAANAGDATWVELCHDGDTCEDAAMSCHASSSLPSSLARCSLTGRLSAPAGSANPGEVHCGTDVCGSGEKCCLRDPYPAYCTPTTTECRCHPTDGG